MTLPVAYQENRASASQLHDHLTQCDSLFEPKLSSRVEIGEYARKLGDRATRFEAWAGGVLVGLVAAYFNADRAQAEERSAYITNVSVLPRWGGNSIARTLLDQCVRRAQECGMSAITLEVGASNERARRLYDKAGFRAITDGDTLTMRLQLTQEEPDERQT